MSERNDPVKASPSMKASVAVIAFASLVGALTSKRVHDWSQRSRMMRTAANMMPGMAQAMAGAAFNAGAVTDHESTRAPVVMFDARGRRLRVWDQPMAVAWPAEHEWNAQYEAQYEEFVRSIGRGIMTRTCIRMDDCLNNPAVNPLHDPSEVRLGLRPDCADVPYTLRAYFAFKKHLPFGFVSQMGGEGGDPRYLHHGVPMAWRQWSDFRTPRTFFDRMPSIVHSGMFRLAPELEDGDTVPAHIDRNSIRPGTMYYDTNGHVLVVSEVLEDGNIQFIDGHPGGSITHPRFDVPRQSAPGSVQWGGGFRNWRPQRLVNGHIVRAPNEAVPTFAPREQYDRANYQLDGVPVPFEDWVRGSLRTDMIFPAQELAATPRS